VSATAQGPIDARLEAYRAMFRLDGKTALVLGAASGIGKASAEALAALGRGRGLRRQK
jgi:NADPH:quinone reductase-like Zn-dependent oxidoreductase